MTTFTEVTDAELDPEQPVLSSTQVKLRDNVYAIIEGDATASARRIQTNALADNCVTIDKIEDMTALVGYGTISGIFDSILTTAFIKHGEFKVGRGGSVSASFTLQATSNTSTARLRVNGSDAGTLRSTTGTQTFTETLSELSAGDLVQVYADNGNNDGSITDFYLGYNEFSGAMRKL